MKTPQQLSLIPPPPQPQQLSLIPLTETAFQQWSPDVQKLLEKTKRELAEDGCRCKFEDIARKITPAPGMVFVDLVHNTDCPFRGTLTPRQKKQWADALAGKLAPLTAMVQ